jgi:Predicted nucleotide-binding protein containing TIR-like domain
MLQRLNGPVLRLANNTHPYETYLPTSVAFYHCGDSAALAFARKSNILVLSVLRSLFDKELEGEGNDQRQFTAEEVEVAARVIDSSIEPNTVFTGLYLAQEFSVFTMNRRDNQQIGIVAFSLNEGIYQTFYLDWDEHIRRSNISAARTSEHQGESETSLPPLSAAGLELYAIPPDNRKIFVVHGHAEEPQENVARFLRSVGLEVVILHGQVNQGQTIIEKLEKHSDVGFAVVLLTPDDVGASGPQPKETQPRARQNVILELGYFMGKLGRNKVCCLHIGGVELPSDYLGVLYVPYDEKGNWRWKLVKELSAAGIEVDSQKLSTVREWDGAADLFRSFFGPRK